MRDSAVGRDREGRRFPGPGAGLFSAILRLARLRGVRLYHFPRQSGAEDLAVDVGTGGVEGGLKNNIGKEKSITYLARVLLCTASLLCWRSAIIDRIPKKYYF